MKHFLFLLSSPTNEPMTLNFSSGAVVTALIVKREAANHGLADLRVPVVCEPEASLGVSALLQACIKVLLSGGGKGVGVEALAGYSTLETWR